MLYKRRFSAMAFPATSGVGPLVRTEVYILRELHLRDEPVQFDMRSMRIEPLGRPHGRFREENKPGVDCAIQIQQRRDHASDETHINRRRLPIHGAAW